MSLLEARDLTKVFGGLTAVNYVDLEVFEGEILGLIGPNGAGKTTIFNMITGIYAPTEGWISFQGQTIAHPELTWRKRFTSPVWWGRRGRIGATISAAQLSCHPTVSRSIRWSCLSTPSTRKISSATRSRRR